MLPTIQHVHRLTELSDCAYWLELFHCNANGKIICHAPTLLRGTELLLVLLLEGIQNLDKSYCHPDEPYLLTGYLDSVRSRYIRLHYGCYGMCYDLGQLRHYEHCEFYQIFIERYELLCSANCSDRLIHAYHSALPFKIQVGQGRRF